jgi:glycyl-tRNA synthetase beta chain
MSKVEDFLVEIGIEELPPQQIDNLSVAFSQYLQSYLTAEGIAFNIDGIKTYGSPRRLAILIPDVATQQQERLIEKRGPAITASFAADGTPSKAALGFAESCGVDIKSLTELKTDKGAWLYFSQQVAGQKTIDLLPTLVQKALAELPIKKPMRWGNGEFAFVRPVHWVLMLLGKEIVKANIFGIEASNISYGHRIHAPKAIKISSPNSYAKQLAEANVIADFSERRNYIQEQINLLATRENGTAVIVPELLNMVTGLVEHPVVLLATFDPAFLRVPKECLISSMQDHQKCFALLDKHGQLMPKFILVSNLDSTDPKTVIHGNELVMHARLADAAFYYDKDKENTLESRVEQLKTVVYQKQLGSLYDKVIRIQKLAAFIAEKIKADVKLTERAAYLCKADLLTNMVYEFPELQGTMGKYYATHEGENKLVAEALEGYYKPRFATDNTPDQLIDIALALADRIDTLAGFFGIGLIPTGEKDPYALRRQAIAILRILVDGKINLDLATLFAAAYNNYSSDVKNKTQELISFCLERLKLLYCSNNSELFASVTTLNINNPYDFVERCRAVEDFRRLPEAANLAAANKRVQNLLQKNPSNGEDINKQLLTEPAEQQLFDALQSKQKEITPLLTNSNYVKVLQTLASLQQPVDNFFTHVMVMVDDEKIRTNRLNLLQHLRNLFLKIADISVL